MGFTPSRPIIGLPTITSLGVNPHERFLPPSLHEPRCRFDAGRLSSAGGLMLLKDPDDPLGFTRALAAVLKDPRDPRRVHFPPHDLLKQRVLHMAAGYEDANDAH